MGVVALVRAQDAFTASHAAAVVAFRGVLHARIALADVDALVPTVSRQTRVSVVPRTSFAVRKTVATLVVYVTSSGGFLLGSHGFILLPSEYRFCKYGVIVMLILLLRVVLMSRFYFQFLPDTSQGKSRIGFGIQS